MEIINSPSDAKQQRHNTGKHPSKLFHYVDMFTAFLDCEVKKASYSAYYLLEQPVIDM